MVRNMPRKWVFYPANLIAASKVPKQSAASSLSLKLAEHSFNGNAAVLSLSSIPAVSRALIPSKNYPIKLTLPDLRGRVSTRRACALLIME
jgi:hypothetical protein